MSTSPRQRRAVGVGKGAKMLTEIIKECLEKNKDDIASLKYVGQIEFFDIFPKSEKQKTELENEAENIAKIVDRSVRGNFYKFNKPLKTIFGELKFFKIRFFDKTKAVYDGAPDFIVKDYRKFIDKYKNDKRFAFIKQETPPPYEGYKFQTEKTWACFINPPMSATFK